MWFVDGYANDRIPDYQCAAFMMAVALKDMTGKETAALTRAMVQSGEIMDLSDLGTAPRVDKHSTGGVGDKTSLILAPIVASLGAVVPMMSGRGLGHTGGTLDKLESIPGFTVDLGVQGFKEALKKIGVAIVSTSSNMCPADRKMYALRDVTATVRGVPLQTASIMCKKLAENPDSLVLDVKMGKGAFNEHEEESIRLAQSMIAAGERDGKPTTAFVSAMNQPLGCAVGNWFEVAEAIRTLRGEGPKDLEELSVQLAAQMLTQAFGEAQPKAYGTRELAAERARATLRDGTALATFRRMVDAQRGDPTVVDDLANSPHGPERPHGAGGTRFVVMRGIYGAGEGEAKPLAALQKGGTYAIAHPPFWAPPVGDGTPTLDELMSAATADATGGAQSAVAKGVYDEGYQHNVLLRSRQGPHGSPVACVTGLDALAVGQANVVIGAGKRLLGEQLTMGAGVLLHAKLGRTVKQGDVLFTLVAEVGGEAGKGGTRRVITMEDVDEACGRLFKAYTFGTGPSLQGAATKAAEEALSLIRCFIDRDGTVNRLDGSL